MDTPGEARVDGLQFVVVRQDDPLAAPLLDELTEEYRSRYGPQPGTEYYDLRTYRVEEFSPPGGVLVIGLRDGVPAAGGAFRRYDLTTAELKRMWTATSHRKQGLGKLVVAELERLARQQGYRRIYLTTGPRQPEAVALYLAMGYTQLYNPDLPADVIGEHPFEKWLSG